MSYLEMVQGFKDYAMIVDKPGTINLIELRLTCVTSFGLDDPLQKFITIA